MHVVFVDLVFMDTIERHIIFSATNLVMGCKCQTNNQWSPLIYLRLVAEKMIYVWYLQPMTRFVNKSMYGFFLLMVNFDTSRPNDEQMSCNIFIEKVESFKFFTRSQMLWASYMIGCTCWVEMSDITWFLRICNWLSHSASFCSSSSSLFASTTSFKLLFEAKREKKLAICWLVRNSVLSNRRSMLLSFAVLVTLETLVGSAFCPVCSPIWNLAIKYSVCLVENRVLRAWECLRTHPIESDGPDDCGGDDDTRESSVPCNSGAMLAPSSSFDAYPGTTRSRSVSYSRARFCFPYSRCRERDFLYSQTQRLIYLEERFYLSSIWSEGVVAKPVFSWSGR